MWNEFKICCPYLKDNRKLCLNIFIPIFSGVFYDSEAYRTITTKRNRIMNAY